MTHPILEPLVAQLPSKALSRIFIEEDNSFENINKQLAMEQEWLCNPYSIDNNNHNGSWYLDQNGYSEWLKDAEDEDFVRMVGVIQLTLETFSALEEDLD